MSGVSNGSPQLLSSVDHLVYGTPDLQRGVGEIEELLGVRATPGGRHPRWGTRNALIALGPLSYLEIIAPDPEQPAPETPRLFGIDDLEKSRLVTWAAGGSDLKRLRSEAEGKGIHLGEVRTGSRQAPDGALLSWSLTDPGTVLADGIVPFFIDWGESPHPARTAAQGAALIGLRAEHPEARSVEGILRSIGLDLPVRPGAASALIALIDGPRGSVELR